MDRFLSDESFDAERAGHKAARLHELLLAGFRVPAGFVVFHDEDLAALGDERLEQSVARLGGWPVAVRSSGCLEDLPDASFAGLYETFLDVADLGALRRAVEACRVSGKGERVRTYLERAGHDPDAGKVSALVQSMVHPRVAGVGFSLHPLSGREEHALVECCGGLGDKLVSGHVTPSRYVLTLRSGAVVEHKPGSEGATLTPHERQELAAALLDIQALLGCPQDVEWAVDQEGTLHVLQSRPITSFKPRGDVDALTNADLKDGGVSARVCTPLMFSLYRNAMQESLQGFFTSLRLLHERIEWMWYFYGRVYWSAAGAKRCFVRIPGFDERAFDQDLGIQKDYGPAGPHRTPTTVKTLLRAIPVALALQTSFRRQLEVVQAFRAPFQREREHYLDRAASFATTADRDFYLDLERVLHVLHTRTEQAYFTTIYNNSTAQSEFKSFLTTLDQVTGGTTSVPALLGGLANISHMGMQRGILRLYRVARGSGLGSEAWERELQRFLADNDFHGDAELDLTAPRWGERPERVTEMVRSMLEAGAEPSDPDHTIRQQERVFAEELERVERRIRRRLLWRLRFGSGFAKHLERVRTYLSRREEMREYSSQCYLVVRLYVLEAGRRMARSGLIPEPDAIFMLHSREIGDLVRGRLDVPQAAALITYRRKIYRGYRSSSAPNECGRGVEQRAAAGALEQVDGRLVLRGLGCSPGRVEGVARVVGSLAEISKIEPGDILVTRFTDPGWTPVLGMVRGVVTEVGGLLSHAAVIGREYGIPAVLDLPGATQVLRSGQRIRVDGDTGLVEVLDGDPEGPSSPAADSA